MAKLKKPLLFALRLLPLAFIGGIFVAIYQMDVSPPERLQEVIEQLGSKTILISITAAQSALYTFTFGFLGYLLAEQTCLWKRFTVSQKNVIVTILLSVGMGIVFSFDYWTFGRYIPEIRAVTRVGMTISGVMASVLYGGVVEEVLLRLFILSLASFLIWKIFFRKKEILTDGIFWIANIFAALLFAVGHLPATIATFGELTPLLIFRCFLLNGGFALGFGWLYKKYGIVYAMLSHATVHLVSKLIWLIFI